MIPKSWRIKLFNWLGAGKLTLTSEQPQEYDMSYSSSTGGFGIMPNGILGHSSYSNQAQLPQTGQTMTIKITPANGGTIIQMNAQEYSAGELYIIPDGSDFDRELGKIITMSKLKA